MSPVAQEQRYNEKDKDKKDKNSHQLHKYRDKITKLKIKNTCHQLHKNKDKDKKDETEKN